MNTEQLNLNLSSFSNDPNNVLENLSCVMDLPNLNIENQQLIIKLDSVRNKVIKTLKRYAKISNRLSDLFEIDNLKLYDLSSFIYDNQDKYTDDDFYSFCDFSFHKLEDYCDNTLYYRYSDLVNYIGRSSSFNYNIDLDEYLNRFMENNFDDYDNAPFIQTDIHNSYSVSVDDLDEIIDTLLNWSTNYRDFDNEVFKEYLVNITNDFDMINIRLIQDFFKENEPVFDLYRYIKNFKKNQIDYFKEYVDF